MRKLSIRTIVGVGLMAALVFVGSYISFQIPTAVDNTRLHLGNIFCLLGAFLLGSWRGGLAAGIGSMLYDFTNPLYISSAPITFINKFLMAFVCGCIISAFMKKNEANLSKHTALMFIAAVCGSLTYIVLYLTTNFARNVLFDKVEVITALLTLPTKALTSLVNGIIADIVSVPLAIALRAGLIRGGLKDWIAGYR